MIRNILTARTMASTADKLRLRHEQAITKLRAAGVDVAVHDDADVQVAYVNDGRWLIDCVCGSGVLVDPEWQVGRCFGCGAHYTAITFPLDREAIEAALVQRPRLSTRHWLPSETADMLRAENAAHGVGGRR